MVSVDAIAVDVGTGEVLIVERLLANTLVVWHVEVVVESSKTCEEAGKWDPEQGDMSTNTTYIC